MTAVIGHRSSSSVEIPDSNHKATKPQIARRCSWPFGPRTAPKGPGRRENPREKTASSAGFLAVLTGGRQNPRIPLSDGLGVFGSLGFESTFSTEHGHLSSLVVLTHRR